MSLTSRFEMASPLPGLPAVTIDSYLDGIGLAQPTARSRRRQARVLWIDATANVDRYNSDAKVEALVAKIKATGFNTVVFDIKPISGQVVYPSKIAPKLTEWRGQSLPKAYDPLAAMCRETKRVGLSLIVSLNAFSEGHELLKIGPGYAEPDRQTVIYEPQPILLAADGATFSLSNKPNAAVSGKVAVFTSARPPAGGDGGYEIELDQNGAVLSRSAVDGRALHLTALPTGGAMLYGAGAAGGFLESHVHVGALVHFDTKASFAPIAQSTVTQYPLMMNPNDPSVRAYELSIAREVATNYAVDGIMYDDRLRYAGIDADFSQFARNGFEAVIKRRLTWPDDVLKLTINENLASGVRPGRYFDQWMAWRASVVRDFLADVRQTIQAVRPGILLGMYSGSWYGEYPALGNNYAAPQTNAGFWFLTPNYRRSGDAPLVDFVMAGCYYKTGTIYDALSRGVGIGSCVESAARLVNRLVRDQAWTYAGISLSDFAGNPIGLQSVLQAACASSEGVMVFDLSHNIDPMWPIFARAFAQPMLAPHSDPSILADVRRRRAALDRLGIPDPTIVIAAGSAGVGQ